MTSNALRSLRKKLGLTQAELGYQIKVDGSTISRYERGNRHLPRNFIILLRGAGLISKRQATR